MAIFQVRRFVFSVYGFVCFVQGATAPKALKGFCRFLFIFNGTLLFVFILSSFDFFFEWLRHGLSTLSAAVFFYSDA